MPVSQAKVKQVLSGDTLVLASINNPTQERTLSLAFVSAPRMRREGDEVSIFDWFTTSSCLDAHEGALRVLSIHKQSVLRGHVFQALEFIPLFKHIEC